MPALLQSTWTWPKTLSASSAAREKPSRSVTSSSIACTGLPSRASRADSMWSGRRSAITTFIPAPAKAVAMPSPIPLAPPVTNAVLPATSCTVSRRPGSQGGRLPRTPAVLDREPLRRHRLVGERRDRLVEDPAQLVAVVGMGEDVEVVVPDRAEDLVADLVRVHPGLVQPGEDLHELGVCRGRVGRERGRPDLVALVDLALHQARADHGDADPVRQQAPAQRVGEAVDGELRRRVDPRARAGDERRHRGGVDDVAALDRAP